MSSPAPSDLSKNALLSHSRSPSMRSPTHQPHAPINPSTLREAMTLSQSPEDRLKSSDGADLSSQWRTTEDDSQPMQQASGTWSSDALECGMDGTYGEELDKLEDEEHTTLLQNIEHAFGVLEHEEAAPRRESVNETTALLHRPFEIADEHAHPGPCNHGTFSPRPLSRVGSYFGAGNKALATGAREIWGSLGDSSGGSGRGNGSGKRMSTTDRLAQEHGLKTSKAMYLIYYIPLFAWARQYKLSYLKGDFVAAVTMASFYIPMALSYASNLGHVPPINGLYAFVFNPFIYAILGSCPQMVVGPEAAGSLLVGSVVRSSVDKGKHHDSDDLSNGRVAGVVTGMAGAVIFIAGLTRLGFLDSVLSRPFMRGFISSVGFIIIIDQLITEMGLNLIAERSDISHGSSVDKIEFLFSNWRNAHGLTCLVAGISFVVIMVARETKKRLQPRYPAVAYIPDRFLVVALSAIFTWKFDWDRQGLQILGEVKSASGKAFTFHWPFQFDRMSHIREAMGTSFLIALLGFFESSVAAKSLGGGEGKKDGLQGIQLSANRELIALGTANLIGGCFMSLPAFGGYGRSKVNASTGGTTPMSSVFLSLITVICVLFLLPYFYFIPKAVLCSMVTVVAWTLIEEAPHDIAFFMRIRGFTELGLMLIIFAATIFYSLSLGIAIGVGLSLLSVIKHSTRPRIQILGRIPGTNKFENAEDNPSKLEFIEGCLIIKIPEPLTFANTGDLKNRLRRLELYGTTAAHPALPRVRAPELNRNVIFDIHGVTGLDGSGTQVLEEIVRNYRERGVRVFFSRGPQKGSPIWKLFERSKILEEVGGERHFVEDVGDALRLTEVEDQGDEAYGNMAGDEGGG